MPSPSALPAWLPHYLTVAACLDAAPCPPPADAPEMSEAVFQALVEGPFDDIEELPDWGQRPRPATPLADHPLRAIALAALCRVLPTSEAIALLTALLSRATVARRCG